MAQGLFQKIRSTSFLSIVLWWLIAIFVFGLFYWVFSLFTPMTVGLETITFDGLGLFKGLYASFLVATLIQGSTVALGSFQLLAYIQLAWTVIVLFILVDKIIQLWMMPHYHANFTQHRKINTVMVMLSVFRSDVDRIRYEYSSAQKEKISSQEIESIIDNLYVACIDVEKLCSSKNIHKHAMSNAQLLMLMKSVDSSLETLDAFITFLDKHHVAWQEKQTTFWLRYIFESTKKIVEHLDGVRAPQMIVALENIREYTDRLEKKI